MTGPWCAKAGYRTIVMSTDPAHSLGDSFDIELGPDLTPISENLWAHEVSSLHEMQRHWTKLHEYAVEVFSTQGLDEVLADEVANPPGMDEVASLMWIKHYAQRAEHDHLDARDHRADDHTRGDARRGGDDQPGRELHLHLGRRAVRVCPGHGRVQLLHQPAELQRSRSWLNTHNFRQRCP